MLYSKDAKVYISAQSEAKWLIVIEKVKSRVLDSKGDLIFLHLT